MKVTNATIRRLKKRNEEAFNEVFYEYKDTLFYLALKYIKNRDEAKNCVQDIFMKLFNNIDKYDDSKTNFNAWFIQLAKNYIIDVYRKTVRENNNIIVNDEIVASFAVDNDIHFSLMLDEIKTIIGEDAFDIFIYRIVDKLSFEGIAHILNINREKVRRIFNNAYKKAKDYFKTKEDK